MKVAILAGGSGSRLAEETENKPKPLVQIGDKPILWHIMRYCSHFGFCDFVIALGYKGDAIKRYFADISQLDTEESTSNWQVALVDTGQGTMTGGRLKRLTSYLSHEPFLLLWSDGLFDVDMRALVQHHKRHGKLATMVVVSPPSRFGHARLEGELVVGFEEKPIRRDEWINAGIFILEPATLDYIAGDATSWEQEPLQRLAADGELVGYKHTAFWQCMDTVNDMRLLEQAWQSGHAPWKVWG